MLRQGINLAMGELARTLANPVDGKFQSAPPVVYELHESEWSKWPIQPRLSLSKHLSDTHHGPLYHGCRIDVYVEGLYHG